MKRLDEYNGFKTNQLVIEQKSLARIIYIEIDEYVKAKYNRDIVLIRIALINEEGFEFAECTTSPDLLTPYKPVISNHKKSSVKECGMPEDCSFPHCEC